MSVFKSLFYRVKVLGCTWCSGATGLMELRGFEGVRAVEASVV